jgi:hypothetical protein
MVTPVAQAITTYSRIETLVRRLTACPGESSLKSVEIQVTVNDIYNNDFPYAIKLDQMRSVYTFYTRPYIDRYPLDVNYNQGVRSPVYVDGIAASFYKDRSEFFNRMWPRFPTYFNQYGASSLTGGISNITQANPGQVTSASHGLSTGNTIYIYNVTGMTQVNNQSFTVTVIDANNFTIGVNTSTYTAYVSGGSWNLTPVTFAFTLPGPFLSEEVVIGGVDINGNAFSIADDGNGGLWTQTPNPVVSVPSYGANYPAGSPNAGSPIPGMYNQNKGNPGLAKKVSVGTVNYVSGQVSFSLSLPLRTGTTLNMSVSQYQTGKPWSVLFWNNEFHVRPVPKYIHKVEVETYLTPVQFMMSTDSPILNQWVKYLSYCSGMEILRQRGDLQGVENLREGFLRQEGLVLERQATEEINMRNATIFSGSTPNQNSNNMWGGWWG